MCLAIPQRVIAVTAENWVDTEMGGVISRVSTAMIDTPKVGDYLIVHAGFAITRLDVDEAERTLELFKEIVAHIRGAPIALHPRLP
jgi:hydrogenase expression/formation protein HypC